MNSTSKWIAGLILSIVVAAYGGYFSRTLSVAKDIAVAITRTEVTSIIAAVRTEFREDLKEVKDDLKAAMKENKDDIKDLIRSLRP